jgi:ribosome maturation factor RimP
MKWGAGAPLFLFVCDPEAHVAARSLERELEEQVEALGYELVELERVGPAAKPIFRLRIDRPDAEPGRGVTLDDCASVSRALSVGLDERPDIPATYVLEVSSPGVERPLVRPRDFERFAGQEVALAGTRALAGRAKRLEGVLLGLSGEGDGARVGLRLPDGEEIEVPRAEITRAHLVYREVRLPRTDD